MERGSDHESSKFDAIIIGSGIGGLTVASLLSQLLKKKVLILEQHSKLGGFTHSFGKKGKWRWDVGMHYVGDMHPKSIVRKVFDFVTARKVDWKNFPDPFQYYIYPDFKFAVPASAKQYQAKLVEMFPNEEIALAKYFKDLKRVSEAWLIIQMRDQSLLKRIIFGMSKNTKLLLTQTTKEYFDRSFQDYKLKAVLDSQWGDTGLPPSKSPFYVHAMLVSHYIRGAYYPKMGTHRIAESIVEVVKSQGGEARSLARVTDILLDTNQSTAKGCRYIQRQNTPEGIKESNKEVFAPLIISNAGARITYNKWIPTSKDSDMAHRINSVPPGLSSLIVYIGLKENPVKLGISGENFWIFSSYDHDNMASSSADILIGKVLMAFVSFGSAHNPETQNSTAQIITFIDPKFFKNRGEDYKALKNNIATTLIDFVDKHIIGFKDLVEFIDVATPLTVSHYSEQPCGEIYGLSGTAERYTILKDLGAITPVRNLYLTGADVSMAGIVGALFGGIITFYNIVIRDFLTLQIVVFGVHFFAKKYKVDLQKLKKLFLPS